MADLEAPRESEQPQTETSQEEPVEAHSPMTPEELQREYLLMQQSQLDKK